MSLFLPDPPRILVTRTDKIGDLVLSTPVFSALRKKFPKAHIACLTFLENRDIIEGNPYLDEIILYDKRGRERGILGNLRFAAKLARRKFDVAIHLHATNRMHLVTWLARIPVRIGWKRKCSWALTHSLPDLKKEGKKHEAEYNFDLLETLGIEKAPLETFFPLNEKTGRSLAELLRQLGVPNGRRRVVVNPSASCPSKIWPAERFGQLAARLAEKYDVTVVAIGSKSSRPFVEKARRAAKSPIYDLSGRLTLAMLGSLLKDSALLVSNDSGPVHIASAVKTPVVSIFGRKQPGLSPARWRPLGKNSRVVWKDVGCVECLAHNCQIHFLCLDAISVEEVAKEAESFL